MMMTMMRCTTTRSAYVLFVVVLLMATAAASDDSSGEVEKRKPQRRHMRGLQFTDEESSNTYSPTGSIAEITYTNPPPEEEEDEESSTSSPTGSVEESSTYSPTGSIAEITYTNPPPEEEDDDESSTSSPTGSIEESSTYSPTGSIAEITYTNPPPEEEDDDDESSTSSPTGSIEESSTYPPTGGAEVTPYPPPACPKDITLKRKAGDKEYPVVRAVEILSQDTSTVTVRLNQVFTTKTATTTDIDHIYLAYKTSIFDRQCYDSHDVQAGSAYEKEVTITCNKLNPVAALEICVADDLSHKVLTKADNAEVPTCCSPSLPPDTPVICYVLEINCVSECIDDTQQRKLSSSSSLRAGRLLTN